MKLFLVAFAFSFIGSIPPGSINLSVIQLALKRQLYAAFRFALAAALVEFGYAYIAVEFQFYITSSPLIQDNFTLISAIVLIILGAVNLIPKKNKRRMEIKLEDSGFRKGVLISLANPLAIPFWIAVTAYLQANNWILLERTNLVIYILGISTGTLSLLALLAVVAEKASNYIRNESLIRKIPGAVLLILGLYSLGGFFLDYFSR